MSEARIQFNMDALTINAGVTRQLIAIIHKLHPETGQILCELQDNSLRMIEVAHGKMEEGLEFERNEGKGEFDPASVMAGVKKTLDESGEN